MPCISRMKIDNLSEKNAENEEMLKLVRFFMENNFDSQRIIFDVLESLKLFPLYH